MFHLAVLLLLNRMHGSFMYIERPKNASRRTKRFVKEFLSKHQEVFQKVLHLFKKVLDVFEKAL